MKKRGGGVINEGYRKERKRKIEIGRKERGKIGVWETKKIEGQISPKARR